MNTNTTITALRQFVNSNPAYILVCGDANTDVDDIETVVKTSVASFRKKGRNPVLVGVTDNAVSEVAATVAEEIHVPVMFGDPDTIIKDIDSRNLRKDHVQVSFMYTPEYAGSAEHLALLYGCRRFGGTLRSWSNFHHQWMNCKWNQSWVPGYNEKFLKTLNSYSMSEQEKQDKFAYRILYIQKYPSLYAKKDKSGSDKPPMRIPRYINPTMARDMNHEALKLERQKAAKQSIPAPMPTVSGDYARVF